MYRCMFGDRVFCPIALGVVKNSPWVPKKWLKRKSWSVLRHFIPSIRSLSQQILSSVTQPAKPIISISMLSFSGTRRGKRENRYFWSVFQQNITKVPEPFALLLKAAIKVTDFCLLGSNYELPAGFNACISSQGALMSVGTWGIEEEMRPTKAICSHHHIRNETKRPALPVSFRLFSPS